MMSSAEIAEAVRAGNVAAFIKQLKTERDADRRLMLIALLAEHKTTWFASPAAPLVP